MTGVLLTVSVAFARGAEVADRFEKEGMLHRKTTTDYRNDILRAGESKDAASLAEDFLGRPYRFEPFAHWLNKAASE